MYRKLTLVLTCILLSVSISTIASAQDYPWEAGEAAAAGAGLFGFSMLCCVLIALPWIIGLLIGIWVYKDAEKRGKSGILWLLIVWFVAFPIGLIIWFVVRPPIGGEKKAAASDRRCPNCGRAIPMDARTCPYCGKKFEQE